MTPAHTSDGEIVHVAEEQNGFFLAAATPAHTSDDEIMLEIVMPNADLSVQTVGSRGSPLEAMKQKGFALRREAPEFVLTASIVQVPWHKSRSMRRSLRRHTASWHNMCNLQCYG